MESDRCCVEEGEEAGVGEVGGGAWAVREEVVKERQVVVVETEVQQKGVVKGLLKVGIKKDRPLDFIFP